jgi:SAM-dependent methyltransferase
MKDSLRPVAIPPGFTDQVIQDLRESNLRVRHDDLARTIPNYLKIVQRGAYEMLQPFLGARRDVSILEIGSGYGLGLCSLLLNGFDACGVEPGRTSGFEGRYERACELLRHNACDPSTRLMSALGESLPFANDAFDIVFSIAVLEHVDDPHQVMREAIRVCKPGGLVIMNVPNYDSFWEGHYNIFWLPYLLNHRLGSAYVRLFGRDPYFIDELNFTTPWQFDSKAAWAGPLDELRIYPFLFRPLLYISAFHYFGSIHAWEQHPVLRFFSPAGPASWFRPAVSTVAKTLTWMGTALGLAPVFNVVARKTVVSSIPSSR